MLQGLEFKIPWGFLNRPQQELVSAQDRFVLLSAGLGAGKTTGLAIMALVLAAANPGVPGLLVAATQTSIESTLLYQLRRLTGLPWRVSGLDRSVRLDGRTPIYIRTAEGWQGWTSENVGWITGDEIRYWPREAYRNAISRCRIPCPRSQRVFGSTPQIGWMSEEFDAEQANRRVIHASTDDNTANLDAEYLTDLETSYSPRMLRMMRHGEFVNAEGAVYESFDSKLAGPWVVNYDEQRWADVPSMIWIDPGVRRSSVSFVRPHPVEKLTWIIHHQMQPEDQTVERTVEKINALTETRGWKVGDIWIDPAADAREQATGINVMQVIRCINRRVPQSHIAFISPPYDGIVFGVERVAALLGDGVMSKPRLLWSRAAAEQEKDKTQTHGRGDMRSLAAYRYPEAKDGRPLGDLPLKDGMYDHACDKIRYGAVGLWLRVPELKKKLRSIDPSKTGYRIAS